MALHLITGRANAGKSGLVNEHLAKALARGEAPVLIVPTLADVRRAMGELSQKFPVGVRVATWKALIEGLWRLHGDGRRLLGESTRLVLLAQAVSEAASPALERVSGTRGFGLTLGRLIERMPFPALAFSSVGSLDADLFAICGRYSDIVEKAGLIEPAHACQLLSENPPHRTDPVIVNRFDVLDRAQIELACGLSRNTDVTVAVVWDDGFAPTRAVDSAVQKLAESASTWERVKQAKPRNELERLFSVLYSAEQGVVATGKVRLGMAGGADAEAELAARAVADALARGVAHNRIVIAFADLDLVAGRLATALEARGVPFEIDSVRPVTRTSLGVAFAAALDLALGTGDRTTALALLLGPHSDVSASRVEDIDSRWRANRVAEPQRILSDVIGAGGSETARALEAVKAAGRGVLTSASAGSLVRAIDHLIAARALRAGMSFQDPAVLRLELTEDAAASRALLRAISGMTSVPGTPFTLADVRRALPSIRVRGTEGEHAGFVQVTELSRLRSRRFDTVIIGGLTSAELPVGGSDSLSDELASILGIAPEPGREALARLRFYLAISRARHELVLICKDETSEGAALRPSVVWEEVLDAYRNSEDEPDAWPAGAPEPERVRAADIVESAPVFSEGRRAERANAARRADACPETARGVIRDRRALEGFSAKGIYSASEIEVYLQCPYRWFYERVVRPGEIDTEIDARAVGSLAHGLLKRFYDAWSDEGPAKRITPETLDFARELFARESANAGLSMRAHGLADDIAVARGIRWAARVVEDDARVLPGFVPVEHELAFGDEGTEFEFGGVIFRGRIDRVDRSGGALFVTDYKSSGSLTGLAAFVEEGRVQAVLYAEAARRLLGGAPVAGSVYRSLRTRSMRGFWRPDLLGGMLERGKEADALDSDGYATLVAETEQRVAQAVEGIRAGDIARRPASKDACAFCALAKQCAEASR